MMNERKKQDTENQWETVVQVLSEGGSIELFGRRTSQGWLFSREVIDQTPLLIDEAEIRHSSNVVDSLEKGLALLDRYPWYQMRVRNMHAEFAAEITAAIEKRKQLPPKRNPNAHPI